jgi:hypothetical protein
VGTVTSVALTVGGDAISVSGSPLTTSGTLGLTFNGTTAQYIRGNGTLETFPTLTGFVPYTGATANVNLGTFDLTADVITGATGSYTSSGGGNTLEVTHSSGSGIALNITKGGNGEGLYINKTSGSGNAATIIGTLNATTLVKSGGTSAQFLKADGSVDSNTYVTIDTFETITASKNFALGLSLGSAGGTNQASVFQNTSSLFSGSAGVNVFGFNSANNIYFGKGSDNGGVLQWSNSTVRYYTLPNATGTIALTSDLTGGTVTSVGLSSATSGVTIGSTPITTSGTITLAIATASGSQQGLLSSTDWTTFNNKQNALTNPVTGTGTTNYLPKFTGASTIGNSQVFDNGSGVTINGTTVGEKFNVNGFIGLQASNTQRWHIGADTGNTLYFVRSGIAERMVLTSEGNLGLGVTPSASQDPLLESRYGLFMGRDETNLLNNAYFNSGWKYAQTGSFANRYYQDGYNGGHQWLIAPSGTAGNAISFTQAMTLTANGELCVGRTSAYGAGFLVNVEGNIYASAAIVAGSSVTAGGKIFTSASVNDNIIEVINSDTTNGYGLYVRGGGTATNRYVARFKNGADNDVMWIGPSNVGIGTTSPTAKLVVSGGTANSIMNVSSTFIGTSNGINIGDDGTNGAIGVTNSGTDMVFLKRVAGVYSEAMRIKSDGQIGIGTSTPSIYGLTFANQFTISSTTTYGNLTIAGSSGNSGGIDFGNQSVRHAGVYGLNGSDLGFYTNSTNSGNGLSEKMRITSGGRVGILNTAPQGKFEVGVVDANSTYGGLFFSTFTIPVDTWYTVYYAPSNDQWNAMTEFTWTSSADFNRSGAASMRWAYESGAATLGVVYTLFNNSQNATASFRKSGNEIQVYITGGSAQYYVQVRIQGSRAS